MYQNYLDVSDDELYENNLVEIVRIYRNGISFWKISLVKKHCVLPAVTSREIPKKCIIRRQYDVLGGKESESPIEKRWDESQEWRAHLPS